MSRFDDEQNYGRKRRTREHILEDLSENHLERLVLLKGHVLRRPERDYGVDVTMFHFAENGAVENGEVRFQLKATDRLKKIRGGKAISFPIKTGDLHYWSLETYPFILIVYDAKMEVAYWLDVQEYVTHHPERVKSGRESVNVHIPVSNKLTVESVEAFRNQSLQVVHHLRSQGGFPYHSRKPK
jgi:hypothetical protein